jgi:hypothetical protein
MALSVVDLYRDVLPRTNCKDCGHPTCLAFAGMVVSEKLPLANCPHIAADLLSRSQEELDEQYAAGKWLKRDMAADALQWARQRSASMDFADLAARLGGALETDGDQQLLQLPYFNTVVTVSKEKINGADGNPLGRWEQVFIYNHLAQGGSREPTGRWKGLVEFPNTVSKIKTMREKIEGPLVQRFTARTAELLAAAAAMGATREEPGVSSADLALLFRPLPKIPVMLVFWDAEAADGFAAKAKLLFDETVTEHLDIESILFLSERLMQLLKENSGL